MLHVTSDETRVDCNTFSTLYLLGKIKLWASKLIKHGLSQNSGIYPRPFWKKFHLVLWSSWALFIEPYSGYFFVANEHLILNLLINHKHNDI